ncbi:MAG: hypothetical protein K5876_01875, partial [Ruminiclostridium sp.]|nr:hypothetical protein [Ruminiclostridium sp.]
EKKFPPDPLQKTFNRFAIKLKRNLLLLAVKRSRFLFYLHLEDTIGFDSRIESPWYGICFRVQPFFQKGWPPEATLKLFFSLVLELKSLLCGKFGL